MSEWNRETNDLDALIERLQKQATTDPTMALEVARAAYRRSLNHGLSPQEAYQAVINAMRDVVPDPSVYADHVMMEGGRVSSIIRDGIYHKGALVFHAADIHELATRKREQIMSRDDIKKLGDQSELRPMWADLSPEVQAQLKAHWITQNGDAIQEWQDHYNVRNRGHEDAEQRTTQQVEHAVEAQVGNNVNSQARDFNAEIGERNALHHLIERVLDAMPDEAFKLFDFVVREVKRGRFMPPDAMSDAGMRQGIQRQKKVISDAAVMLNELAKRNKPFPNFTAKDFTIDDLERWMYGDEANRKLLNSLKDDDFEIGPGYDADEDRVVYEFPDGWTMRELGGTEGECQTEGEEMQHCLRHTDEYHWHDKIREGYSRIFSLRDPLNYPHATVEFADDRGMPETNGTWYIAQGPYGKQDKSLHHFPEYDRRMSEWFEYLKDEKNITVQNGDHDQAWYGDEDEDEEFHHEPEHLPDMDERYDPDPMHINDPWDLEQYYDALKSGDSRFDSEEPSDGEQHNDEDGDYWYTYARGQKPEIDVEDVAGRIFEELGEQTEVTTYKMLWGYEMMEALLYAAEHEQADYGGLSGSESRDMQEAVQRQAQDVMKDVRPMSPQIPGQTSFEDEGHPEWQIEEADYHHGMTAEGAKMVNAALNYFMTISTNTTLYQGGFLPDADDTYNIDPERAFNEFDNEDHKILPDEDPEEAPLGDAIRSLAPGEEINWPSSGLQETGRDPATWKDEAYKDEMALRRRREQYGDPLDEVDPPRGTQIQSGGATYWVEERMSDRWLLRDSYNREVWVEGSILVKVDSEGNGVMPQDEEVEGKPNIVGTMVHPISEAHSIGWTPSGKVFLKGDNTWPAEWRNVVVPPQGHEQIQQYMGDRGYTPRYGHVVEAADIGELAAKAYESLISRPDYVKLNDDYERLQALQISPPVPKDVPHAQDVAAKLATHPITVARNIFHRLMRNENLGTYKLWPWVWREIKKDRINVENFRHAIDIIKQAAEMISDMRQNNRIPRGFDINQLEFSQLEQWVYDNQPDHSDEWVNSEAVYTFKDGWMIAQVGADDCVREGDLMGHCVGGYGDDVENGRTEIYSLRDTKGMPHATIELSPALPAMREGEHEFRGTAQLVRQLQGKGNKPPIDEYQQRIREWFNHNNRTSENQFAWSGDYGYGYDQISIRDLSDFYEWWEHEFKGSESLWHNIPAGGGIMLKTETGEYGLRQGTERSEREEPVYVSDWKKLDEQIIWALHVEAGRSHGDTYWRGYNEPVEMAQALYQLCWVTGESFEGEVDDLQEKSSEIEWENVMQNWDYFAREIEQEMEDEFEDRLDIANETIDGDHDKYEEEFEALRDKVEGAHNDYSWSKLYEFLTYCYHLAGIYPSHKNIAADEETGARARVEKSQDEPPVAMLPPERAKEEFMARERQPSLPEIQPAMLTGPELANPIPDEIQHMEDQRAIDMMNPGRVPHPRRFDQQEMNDLMGDLRQTRLTSLDAALAALSSPMEASSLDWTIERHPTAEGFWRIANMRMSSDGRAYHPDEEPTAGFLTHIVANRDLLLDGYAVTDRTGGLALVPLQ